MTSQHSAFAKQAAGQGLGVLTVAARRDVCLDARLGRVQHVHDLQGAKTCSVDRQPVRSCADTIQSAATTTVWRLSHVHTQPPRHSAACFGDTLMCVRQVFHA